MLNDLAEVEGNFALILDDYHSVDCPEIGEILQFLIDNRPDVFHLVLITRIAPSLSLSRLRALDRLTHHAHTLLIRGDGFRQRNRRKDFASNILISEDPIYPES